MCMMILYSANTFSSSDAKEETSGGLTDDWPVLSLVVTIIQEAGPIDE